MLESRKGFFISLFCFCSVLNPSLINPILKVFQRAITEDVFITKPVFFLVLR